MTDADQQLKSDAGQLAELMRAAAEQRRYMHPWVDDREFTSNGGKILHAVDTDVIYFFAMPASTAASAGKRPGYSQVFPGDPEDLSIALGYQLVERLFYRVQREQPLLVLPPMDQEVGRVLSRMIVAAEREVRDAQQELARFGQLARDWQRIESPQELLKQLAADAPKALDPLLKRRGRGHAVSRLRRLLRQLRIVPLTAALDDDHIEDPSFRKAIEAPERFQDRVRLSDFRTGWFDRLKQTKSSRKSNVQVYDDAEVLARIEWASHVLPTQAYRLVLVTGDSAIFDAASQYEPGPAGISFADLYLRHPRAYLGEPDVLTPSDDNATPSTSRSKSDSSARHAPPAKVSPGHGHAESEVVAWLDTLLAAVVTPTTDYKRALDELLQLSPEQLQERCTPVLTAQPTILEEFYQRWNQYTANLKIASFDELIADRANELSSAYAGTREVLIKVESALQDQLRETWDAYFEIATNLGYGFLWQRTVRRHLRPRSPPVLSYDSLTKAGEFVHRVLKSRAEESWDQQYLEELNALRVEDPSRYTYYLAFAVLFAAEGVWHVAELLAEKAMDLVDDLDDPRLSGREAAYMRAVAMRHTAKRVHQLAAVEPMLDEALHRLQIDRQGRSDFAAGEVRFEAERLALQLTYHLFREFKDEHIPEHVPSLARLQDECIRLLEGVDSLRATASNLACGGERLHLIAKSTERSLLTNAFSIAMLRLADEPKVFKTTDLDTSFERFKRNVNGGEAPDIAPSFLVRAVFVAAAWCLEDAPTSKREWRRELQTMLTDAAIEENATFPYEAARFHHLLRLVS